MCLSGDIIVTESVDGQPVFLSLVLLSHPSLTWSNFLIGIFFVGVFLLCWQSRTVLKMILFPVVPYAVPFVIRYVVLVFSSSCCIHVCALAAVST